MTLSRSLRALNKQAALHQFVAYQRQEDNTLQHQNICVISDCKDDTTDTVFAFLKVVLKIFEDGASSC